MKKFFVLALICAAAVSVQAQKATTDEQKALKQEMLAKYDTNKDGKLSKDEIAQMSADDKAKWDKAFPHHGKKKKSDDSSTSTNSTPTTPPSTPDNK